VSRLKIVNQGNGLFSVDSDLTFQSIDGYASKSFSFLRVGKEVTIDLAKVANADSAGLALMVEWIKYARSQRMQIHFKDIPEQLLALAKLSGLDRSSHFVQKTEVTNSNLM